MPADLDNMDQEMDMPSQDMDGEMPSTNHGDQEGAMAKQELIKLAQYANSLQEHMNDGEQLEAWIQAKITMASVNIASVYHYLAYEKKMGEYSDRLDNNDTLSESQKRMLKFRLNEAKEKIKDLKKVQSEKIKAKKVEEGILSGGDRACTECGGTGMVYEEPKEIPHHVKNRAEKYKTLMRATKAAHKRMDHHNGHDHQETEMDEEREETTKTQHGSQTAKFGSDGKRKSVQHRDERKYSDETHAEPPSKAKAQSSKDKEGSKQADKQQDKDSKDFEKRFPGSVTRVVGGKKVDPKAPKEKKKKEDEDLDENIYGQGVFEGKKCCCEEKGKMKCPVHGEKKMDEAKKKSDGNLANNYPPFDKVTRGDVVAGRLGKDQKGGKKVVKEGMAPHDMAHYHACKCAECYMEGNLEMAMHHKDMCEQHGGTVHMAQGQCHHSHPHINNGDMYECGSSGMMYESKQGDHKKPCPPMSHVKKMCQDGKSVSEICKMHPDCDHAQLKKMVSDCKKKMVEASMPMKKVNGKSVPAFAADGKGKNDLSQKKNVKETVAANMWKNMKETVAYVAEKKAMDKKIGKEKETDEGGNLFVGALKKAREEGDTTMTVDGKSIPVKPGKPIPESTEIDRLRQLTGRLNQSEKPTLVENREVDQIRALTKRLLG